MITLPSVLAEIEAANESRSMSRRTAALNRVTAYFAERAPRLSEAQVDAFDDIILRLADEIETRARAFLAERLADIPNAPPRCVSLLARDPITVAKPLLERSQRLGPDELIAIGGACGRDHMLAIAARKDLAESVANFLAGAGDRVVVHAVSANHTAKFSNHAMASLIERARDDQILETVLRGRSDIPAHLIGALLEVAKDTARRRLRQSGEQDDVLAASLDRSAESIADDAGAGDQARRLAAAAKQIEALVAANALDEAAIIKFAKKKMFEHSVCAIAAHCIVPVTSVLRAFLTSDRSALFVAARAKDMDWTTVALLLNLLSGPAPSPQQVEELARDYRRFRTDTAAKILQFMLARDAARPAIKLARAALPQPLEAA